MNVGIYARFSDTKQRVESIDDQWRDCRNRANRESWPVTGEYSDPAISGSIFLMRPGIQAVIADAHKGRFQILLAESLSRLSRELEDLTGNYPRPSAERQGLRSRPDFDSKFG